MFNLTFLDIKENRKVNCKEYKDLMRNYWGEILYKYVYKKINKLS